MSVQHSGIISESSADYGSVEYWIARYTQTLPDGCYDWYLDADLLLTRHLLPLLKSKPLDAEILIPGCGCSSLPAALYALGWHNLSAVDFCEVVVEHMNRHKGSNSGIEYAVMDARHLDGVPDSCFDVIVDKGLLDALLCSETNAVDVARAIDEMYRVLAPGGIYVVISHSASSSRLHFLQRPSIRVEPAVPLLDGMFHMFVCRK